jgi:hypothetical protein
MGEPVDVSGAKDEASSKLKRVLPQLVLMMTRRECTLAALRIIAAEQMKQIGGPQPCRSITLALLVD